MYEILRKLGLTKYESLAYLELAKHDKLGAFELSKQSSVPFGRIYNALSELENKGFVETIPEKPKKYRARDPKKAIEEFVESSKHDLDKVQKEAIEKIKELGKIPESSGDLISVTRGETMMAKQAAELVSNAKKEVKSLTYDFEMSEKYPTFRKYTQQLRDKNGIFYLMASDAKQNKKKLKEIGRKKNTLTKICKINDIHLTIADGEDVLIGIHDPENYPFKELNIHIKNKKFGKAMDQFYDSIWKSS